jgi:IS5 family transposase
MNMLTSFQAKTNQPLWHLDPELALCETVLTQCPEVLDLVKDDVLALGTQNNLGRHDSPSVEQIVRAAIYKEVKGLTYQELEYHQYDSKIAEVFLQVTTPFSDSVLQKYIAAISASSLESLMKAINQIAMNEGLEDLQKLRTDTTVVETDIHYPTNNSLLWDCIRTSTRILRQLEDTQIAEMVRDYTKQAKTYYFMINVTKDKTGRHTWFEKQFPLVDRCLSQTRRVVAALQPRVRSLSPGDQRRYARLTELLPDMEQIRDVAYRREILGESVASQDKLLSLYEPHTQMIVKGKGKVFFGRKVSLASGRSNLILQCQVCDGETDGELFDPTLEDVIATYHRVPRDVATDGAYASTHNQQVAQGLGITNIVFTKVVGSLTNIVSSLNMETRLKTWRSGIEAVISNVKRGFGLRRCPWKGHAHFEAKVFWSVIAYNLRVMSALLLQKMSASLAS